MNQPTEAKPPIRTIDAPALILEFLRGRCLGFPLHQLGGWEYVPVGYEPNSTLDRVKIDIFDKAVEITGRNLGSIQEALASGNGFVIAEQGERYIALADDGICVVGKIAVESRERT